MSPLLPLEVLALSIKRLQYRNYRVIDAKLAPLGISLVQWGALREIELNPGFCMHRLAELTFNSDQAFGTLMARLLRQKLVERQPGAGRANVHRLTSHGKTLLGEGRKRVRQVLTRTFAPLTADQCARLQDLLNKVLRNDALDTVPRAAKTLAGIAPGDPVIRAGGHHHQKAPGPARLHGAARRIPRSAE